MRYPFFLALLFAVIFLSGPALAWEESFEGHWDDLPYTLSNYAVTASLYPHTIYYTGGAGTTTLNASYTGYLRFSLRADYNTDFSIKMYDSNGVIIYDVPQQRIYDSDFNSWKTVEIIESGNTVTVYVDGVSKQTASRQSNNEITKLELRTVSTYGVYIDDYSSSPYTIGTTGFLSSSSGTIYSSVAVPQANTYHVTLSKENGELIHTWNLTSKIQTLSYSVSSYFNEDGFYYYDIYDAAGELYYSKLIYYNSLGVYPTSYFTITSDTAADIRDHENNGGTVTGGGTVYLTPSATENYYQDFTIEFQEPAYNRALTLNKVFNTSRLDGSQISLTGLNPNTYNVSIDGAFVGSTSAQNTWSHTVNWIGDNSYTLELSPDFSSPGVWGYVKDSASHENIPYAQLYTINSSYSSNIYADENGMFYLGGLSPGPYSIQASKKGYISSAAQPFTASQGETTRKDIYLESSGAVSGEGLYYAPHSVTFTVIEYWYNTTGLQDVSYTIEDENNTTIQEGTTDSLGQFAVKSMDENIKYKITLSYNGFTDIEYIYPGLSEYTLILHKNSGVIKTYINSWLTLNYSQNQDNVYINYSSNKSLSGVVLSVRASNGTQVYTQTLTTGTGSFNFPYSNSTDYIVSLNVTASDGSQASQNWVISAASNLKLFPDSIPQNLKNTLYAAIIILFVLAFGKAKNDVACLCGAVLVHLGYFFGWLTCSWHFVILIWIITAGAVYIHFKRSGAL